MNAVITTTIISVLGTGFLGVMIQYMRLTNNRLDTLESKLDSLISFVHAQDTKFTNEIKNLEIRLTEKFTAHLTDLRKEVYDGFKAHGERLARIEVELNIQPPPLEVA